MVTKQFAMCILERSLVGTSRMDSNLEVCKLLKCSLMQSTILRFSTREILSSKKSTKESPPESLQESLP